MYRIALSIALSFCIKICFSHTLYLLPGLGADGRLFQNLELPSSRKTIVIDYPNFQKNESLEAYALRLAEQIDTTEDFSLLGVSLGGMLSIELGKKLPAKHVFLVSSAMTKNELPARYTIQNTIPFYKVLGGGFMKKFGSIGARIFEPNMRPHLDLFKSMLDKKDSIFLHRAFTAIVKWENEIAPKNVVHIHGNQDHTLPAKNVSNAYFIDDAGHWLIFLKPRVVENVVLQCLL